MRKILGAGLAVATMALAFGADAALVELTGAAQVSVGGGHACVVTTAGGVKCFGDNYFGQLGDGNAGALNDGTQRHYARSAAGDVVGLTSGVSSVSSGGDHACALMTSGGIKCWGANDAGQLGDGTTVQRATPVDVVGLGAVAIQLAAGLGQTCAVLVDGSLKCWGNNSHGELGDGTTTSRSVPATVPRVRAPLP